MKIHIVQKGDTLWEIAKRYNVNFEQLKSMNTQLSDPNLLMPGMKIKVPTENVPVKKAKKEKPFVKEAPTQHIPMPPPMPTYEKPYEHEEGQFQPMPETNIPLPTLPPGGYQPVMPSYHHAPMPCGCRPRPCSCHSIPRPCGCHSMHHDHHMYPHGGPMGQHQHPMHGPWGEQGNEMYHHSPGYPMPMPAPYQPTVGAEGNEMDHYREPYDQMPMQQQPPYPMPPMQQQPYPMPMQQQQFPMPMQQQPYPMHQQPMPMPMMPYEQQAPVYQHGPYSPHYDFDSSPYYESSSHYYRENEDEGSNENE